ncbi:MAG TPA: hypothetical protein VD913_05605, partial [bacterium]|nr:hypothetical protein [bacterium]
MPGESLEKLRIVVLGYIVRGPLGGMSLKDLHYLTGLARLGHDVHFIEDSDNYPSCYDPLLNLTDIDPSYGLAYTDKVMNSIGLGKRWAYFDAHKAQWFGPCGRRAVEICQNADMAVNICGINPLRSWLEKIPCRVLIDEDPVFTQIRHLTDPEFSRRARQHNAFFSFAENIGRPGCTIPDDGIPWKSTRQPVVLDEMPVFAGHPEGKFTTVMQWESYPSREYQGIRYGMKSESFLPFMDLAGKTKSILELAVANDSAPRETLRQKGWLIVDALKITRDPSTYLEYIRNSKAEFSVAKHGYVRTQSGWFSERSLVYLASGRPVVVQETGFSDWLHRKGGVLSFNSPEQALEGIEEVNQRY